MKILITGAGGFIGTHLCRSLYKDYNVIGIVRTKNKQIALEKECKVKTYEADLSKTFEIDDRIDIIIHAAARSLNSGIPIKNYIYDNIISTQNLIDFAIRKKVELFINLSAISVFGLIVSDVVDEETPIVNPSPYGMSKYMGELLLKQKEDKLISVSFRMPVVVGNEMKNGWLFNTYKKINNSERITIYNPNSPYNMIHVSDIYRLVKSCINIGLSGSNLFTVTCKDLLSIKEIVTTMKKNIRSESPIEVKTSDEVGFTISNKRIKEILNYKPQQAQYIINSFLNK